MAKNKAVQKKTKKKTEINKKKEKKLEKKSKTVNFHKPDNFESRYNLQNPDKKSLLAGKSCCIIGKLTSSFSTGESNPQENRVKWTHGTLKSALCQLGGLVTYHISNKTDILFVGDAKDAPEDIDEETAVVSADYMEHLIDLGEFIHPFHLDHLKFVYRRGSPKEKHSSKSKKSKSKSKQNSKKSEPVYDNVDEDGFPYRDTGRICKFTDMHFTICKRLASRRRLNFSDVEALVNLIESKKQGISSYHQLYSDLVFNQHRTRFTSSDDVRFVLTGLGKHSCWFWSDKIDPLSVEPILDNPSQSELTQFVSKLEKKLHKLQNSFRNSLRKETVYDSEHGPMSTEEWIVYIQTGSTEQSAAREQSTRKSINTFASVLNDHMDSISFFQSTLLMQNIELSKYSQRLDYAVQLMTLSMESQLRAQNIPLPPKPKENDTTQTLEKLYQHQQNLRRSPFESYTNFSSDSDDEGEEKKRNVKILDDEHLLDGVASVEKRSSTNSQIPHNINWVSPSTVSTDIDQDENLVKINGIWIEKKDVKTLSGEEDSGWLNDIIINALVFSLHSSLYPDDNVFILDTYRSAVIVKLAEDEDKMLIEVLDNMDEVIEVVGHYKKKADITEAKEDDMKRVFGKTDIDESYRCVCLVCINNCHYIAFEIDIQNGVVNYYDSLPSHNTPRGIVSIAGICSAWFNKIFRIIECECGRQEDSKSCGIFAVYNLKLLIDKCPVDIVDQSFVDDVRKRWAKALHLLEVARMEDREEIFHRTSQDFDLIDDC